MNARSLILLTVSLLLLGCSGYEVVKLRHPVTGGWFSVVLSWKRNKKRSVSVIGKLRDLRGYHTREGIPLYQR